MPVYAFKNPQGKLLVADRDRLIVIDDYTGGAAEIVALRELDHAPDDLPGSLRTEVSRARLEYVWCQARPAANYMAIVYTRPNNPQIKFETGSRAELNNFANFVAEEMGCSSVEAPATFLQASPEFLTLAGICAALTPLFYWGASMIPAGGAGQVQGSPKAKVAAIFLSALGTEGVLALGGGGVFLCLCMVGWHATEGYRIRTLRPRPREEADEEGLEEVEEDGADSAPRFPHFD